MGERPTLVTIEGPTAVGKTALAIRVAQALQTEIVSADSRQFFRELNIGVARPSLQELEAVKHHFIAFLSVDEEFNAGAYERVASKLLQALFTKHRYVVCAGGSGLYLQALLHGLDEMPRSEEVRSALMLKLQVDGLESLQKQLRELDEAYYHEVDIQNPHRLIRALEVCLTSGKTYSELRTNAKVQRQFDVVSFALDADRNWLYQRINQRVDIMMQQGQEEEARSLYHKRHLNSLNTVGYKELFDFFDGKTSLEDAVSLIKQHTRNYAKRQLTWLRRKQDLKWLRAEEPDLALQTILSILQ